MHGNLSLKRFLGKNLLKNKAKRTNKATYKYEAKASFSACFIINLQYGKLYILLESASQASRLTLPVTNKIGSPAPQIGKKRPIPNISYLPVFHSQTSDYFNILTKEENGRNLIFFMVPINIFFCAFQLCTFNPLKRGEKAYTS
ncbi:hypothetical protein ET464_18940 [Paenibacillus protaetiae]|uniref:Uncharacterized protein n=1 Tax=Paenibacillus protaetiae TaxID=2509456 RepID=A0A4P6F1X4_9BACL|nr:hypothetical protein ET464_18940 [Paenibacillus protaetiae]